jgi:hypothetical protein
MHYIDERSPPLVNVMHADTVYVGEAVIERVGIVGIHWSQCSARLIHVPCGACVHSSNRPFKVNGRKDSPDSLRHAKHNGI